MIGPKAKTMVMESAEEWYENQKPVIKLPKRSKFGVGKMIGGALYLHKDFEAVVPPAILESAKAEIDGFPYTIVKFEPKTKKISFIECDDFDTADEPTVGRSIVVNPETKTAKVFNPPTDPWIYHHKWLFVKDDYQGFDVEAAKERSRQWMSVPDLDMRRIGKKSFWNDNVVPRITETVEPVTFVKDETGQTEYIDVDPSMMDSEESIAQLNTIIIKANAQGIDVKLQGQTLAPMTGTIPEGINIKETWYSDNGFDMSGSLDAGDIRIVTADDKTHITYYKKSVKPAAIREMLEDIKDFGYDNVTIWNGEDLTEDFANSVSAAKRIIEDLR